MMMDVQRLIQSYNDSVCQRTEISDQIHNITVDTAYDPEEDCVTLHMEVKSDDQETWLLFDSPEQFWSFVEDIRLLALQLRFETKIPLI